MTKHVMIDIETLSTQADALILSIGAVKFNQEEIVDQLYLPVSMHEQKRHIDTYTIQWWMQQNEAARKAAFLDTNGRALQHVLDDLSGFYNGASMVWAKPVTFDIIILENAYKQHGKKAPWHYRDTRCMSTLMRLLPKIERVPNPAFTAHNALDDAMEQALETQRYLRALNQVKVEPLVS